MRLDVRIHPDEIVPSLANGAVPWYQSAHARRFLLARFVPLLGAGNLIWETLQLPLYTLGREDNPRAQLFAILHCTAGDVMIGTTSLLIAVILFGRRGWPRAMHGRVLGSAMLACVSYTVFSEWMNTQVTMSWQYAESMLQVLPLGTGIAPLLQWIVVPPIAYSLAYALGRARSTDSGR